MRDVSLEKHLLTGWNVLQIIRSAAIIRDTEKREFWLNRLHFNLTEPAWWVKDEGEQDVNMLHHVLTGLCSKKSFFSFFPVLEFLFGAIWTWLGSVLMAVQSSGHLRAESCRSEAFCWRLDKFLVLIKCSLSHRVSSHESPSAENNHTGGNWKQVITTYIWFCCQAATSSGCSDYYIWKRGSVWFLFLDKDSVLEVILDTETREQIFSANYSGNSCKKFFFISFQFHYFRFSREKNDFVALIFSQIKNRCWRRREWDLNSQPHFFCSLGKKYPSCSLTTLFKLSAW